MIVSINQPAYLPWLGYFERIAASDLHVVLDHVQFEKNSYTNRNRVRAGQGACWLTVPVQSAGRFGNLPITDVRIDNRTNWRGKHWRTLVQNYGRAPYFAEHAPFFKDLYAREWVHLAPLCEAATDYLLAAFNIATPRRKSSQLAPEGRKDEMVLHLCRQLKADVYLSGALGRDYLHPERFAEAGIALAYQDYVHPSYPQWRDGEFIAHLSAVDLLFNCGPDSHGILMNAEAAGRRRPS